MPTKAKTASPKKTASKKMPGKKKGAAGKGG